MGAPIIMGSWGHQPSRLWSRRSWHRWPWSRHSRTRRNRRAGRTRRADLGFEIVEHPKTNKNPVQKMEDPINPLEFLIFCCCCWEFSFKDVFFLVGFSEYFSHLDGWKHFGNQVQFHHVVRGSNFANFHDGHSFFWWQHHLQLMDLSTDTLNLLHCS